MSGKGGKPRKNPGVSGRRPDRKASRQATATSRAAQRLLLTPRERLAELDALLGKGVGANRERARLAKLVGRAAS